MTSVIYGVLATISLLLWMAFNLGHCPRGWSVEGVSREGASQCRPVPPPHCGEPTGPDQHPCPPDDRVLPTYVHCTGGSHPIVVGERVVGCQR